MDKSLGELELGPKPGGRGAGGPSPSHTGEGGPKGRGGRGRGVDFPLRLLVASDMVGAIIGRGGATIRAITQQSRARVDVHRCRQGGVHSGEGAYKTLERTCFMPHQTNGNVSNRQLKKYPQLNINPQVGFIPSTNMSI